MEGTMWHQDFWKEVNSSPEIYAPFTKSIRRESAKSNHIHEISKYISVIPSFVERYTSSNNGVKKLRRHQAKGLFQHGKWWKDSWK
jgi:hypothetical protein